jgi:hypothetical protein
MRIRVIAVALAAVPLALPTGSSAVPSGGTRSFRLSAKMTPEQVVTVASKPWKVPAAVRGASGTLTGLMPADGSRLTWKLVYAKLGSAPVAASIHLGKPGQFGPVLVQLCDPCRSGGRGVTPLKHGTGLPLTTRSAYVTLTTKRYPLGVVRGLLHAVGA